MENNMVNNRPGNKPADKKKTAIIVAAVIFALAIAALCVWSFWLRGFLAAQNASPVYVASVSSIAGVNSDTDPRYSGLVEPQKITSVNKDDSRTVAEVLVKEGDEVTVGTPLFRYDTEEMELSVRQAELELEGIANQITTLNDQKKTLEAAKAKASADEQYSYTVSIQSVALSIKEQEYQRSIKQSEIEKLKASRDNNEVVSEAEGVIQEINLTPKTDNNGQPLPFMSILSSGDFRIKGTVTEQNINAIYEGQPVTIRSRVSSDQVWSGTIDTISYEPAQDNNNNMYYYGGDQGEQSSKYNFYVGLTELEGLILGQHVYIEPDLGESSVRTGLWLPAAYVVTGDGKTDIPEDGSSLGEEGGSAPLPTGDKVGYVWARDENEKLEKRQVLLGEYDQGENLYEIISGLEPGDYIAYPSEDLVVGGPTTTDASAQLDQDLDLMGGGMDLMGGEMDPGLMEGGEDVLFLPEEGLEEDFEPAEDENQEAGSITLPDDGVPSQYEDGLESIDGTEGTE